jgi:hypothetical protein
MVYEGRLGPSPKWGCDRTICGRMVCGRSDSRMQPGRAFEKTPKPPVIRGSGRLCQRPGSNVMQCFSLYSSMTGRIVGAIRTQSYSRIIVTDQLEMQEHIPKNRQDRLRTHLPKRRSFPPRRCDPVYFQGMAGGCSLLDMVSWRWSPHQNGGQSTVHMDIWCRSMAAARARRRLGGRLPGQLPARLTAERDQFPF